MTSNTPVADAAVPTIDYAAGSTMTRYRWIICALLFLATTINYVDRQILSLLKPILDSQLGWTRTQFGLINSAFQAAYGTSVIFFGWYVDRFGAKKGYTLSIGAWSLAALAHAAVNSIGGFFGARIALGLGEGGNSPRPSRPPRNGSPSASGPLRPACSTAAPTSARSWRPPSCR